MRTGPGQRLAVQREQKPAGGRRWRRRGQCRSGDEMALKIERVVDGGVDEWEKPGGRRQALL